MIAAKYYAARLTVHIRERPCPDDALFRGGQTTARGRAECERAQRYDREMARRAQHLTKIRREFVIKGEYFSSISALLGLISRCRAGRGNYGNSSLMMKNFFKVAEPKFVVSATSAASRPVAIRMRPMRGWLWRASNVYHWPESQA